MQPSGEMPAIRVAACDGEPSFAYMLGETINEWRYETGREIIYLLRKDPEALMIEYDIHGHMDLVFMALHPVKGVGGLEAARCLKKLDEDIRIAYVSASDESSREMIETRPVAYELMPLDSGRIKKLLNECERYRSRFFCVRFRQKYYSIPIDSICYISHFRRKIDIYCNNGTVYQASMSLNEAQQRLERLGYHFIRIHCSLIVNPFYIGTVNKRRLNVRAGCFEKEHILDISCAYSAAALKKYDEYLKRLYGGGS